MKAADGRCTVRPVKRHVRRVAVLTADVGEGHLAAARVIADDLRDASPGIEVTTIDALEVLGPLLRVLLRDAYRMQLRHTPWIFALLFGLFLRVRPLRASGLKGANIAVTPSERDGWEDRRHGLLLPLPRRSGSTGGTCS